MVVSTGQGTLGQLNALWINRGWGLQLQPYVPVISRCCTGQRIRVSLWGAAYYNGTRFLTPCQPGRSYEGKTKYVNITVSQQKVSLKSRLAIISRTQTVLQQRAPRLNFHSYESYLICFVSRFFHKEGLRKCLFALTSDFCLSAARPGQREIDVCVHPPPPPAHTHTPPSPKLLAQEYLAGRPSDVPDQTSFITLSFHRQLYRSHYSVIFNSRPSPTPPLSSRPIPGGGRVWWGWFTLTLSLTKVPGRGLGQEGGGGGEGGGGRSEWKRPGGNATGLRVLTELGNVCAELMLVKLKQPTPWTR